MLQGDFYTLTNKVTTHETLQCDVLLNATHRIFEGHFPGHPIVPGVCMMQLVQESIADIYGKSLLLQKADIIKFLTMINPVETNRVVLTIKHSLITDGKIVVDAQLANEATIYFKFKGTFKDDV